MERRNTNELTTTSQLLFTADLFYKEFMYVHDAAGYFYDIRLSERESIMCYKYKYWSSSVPRKLVMLVTG